MHAHVIEPRQREDGQWEMAVRGLAPRLVIEPLSICFDPDTGAACEGHHTALAARGCRVARKVARKIESHGMAWFLGVVQPEPSPPGEDAAREIETLPADPEA